ncbi:MAG: Ig-like domain-containing protein, partial [Spirochaetota bacterium]|nr:Ig-like domain-containing protein [Spirochaetota bacterium]
MKRIILTILIQVFILTLTFIACEEDNRSVWELSTKTYKYINIKTISPSLGMIGAPINTKINIQFTEAIDKTKFPDSFSLKTEYNTYSINNFDILWKDNNKTVQLTPRVFLEKSTIYLLELDNNKIRSAAGNPLESTYSAAFTTGFLADLTPPTVDIACIQTNSGCVAPSGTIAPVNGVRLQFSEPMSPSDVENAFSFTVNGSRVPVLRSVWHTNANNLVDNKSVTLYLSNNTTNVPSGNAKLTLSAAAQDSAGNSLSNPIAANFIVGGANTTDYEVTNLVAPTSGLPSGALNGSFTIRNAGTINGTAPVSWKVYHSADRVFDGGDTLVQSGSHPQLNQNTTSAVINYSGTWPATAGYYHIIIVLSAADDGLAANNQLSSGAIAVG